MPRSLAFLPLMVFVLLGGCLESNKYTVHFVLPDGYRGAFKIIEDADNRANPVTISDDVVTVSVPFDGIVKVTDVGFLTKWHSQKATYSNGRSLPSGMAVSPESDVVAFHSLWTDSEGTSYYFVGTPQELEEVQSAGPWKVEAFMPTHE